MAAGAGSLFKEQFGLAPFFGSITVIAATFVTVALGVSSVIRSISLVVPLLLTAVTYVSVRVIIDSNLIGISAVNALPGNAVVGNWLLAATLYVSYNLILAVAVLAPLGREANDRHSINAGALLGGLGLGLGAIVIATALLLTRSTAAQFEVPMIFLAGTISPLVQTIYSGVLFAEVYTTAVGGLYGFVARLAGSGKKRLWFTAGASLGALVLSGIGFVNLIRYLLPAVGYIGLLLLTGIVYQFVRERSVNLSPIPAVKPQDNRDKRDR